MSIKTIARGLVVACCAALGLNAWANVVAYWNGDLAAGSTKAGWAISAGTGVTIANGTATTTKQDGGTANTGILITPSEAFTSDALTLVIKYSNLDVCSHNSSIASMIWGNGTTMNEHVARVVGKASCGMSNGGTQLNAANYTIPDAGTMAISMSNAGGMRISFKATDATSYTAAAWYTGSDVKLGTKFGAMKVGGCSYNIGTYHRPGMTIESVAIIDEVIDTGSTFEIPTEYIAVPGQITTTAKLIPGVTMDMLKDAQIAAFSSAAHIDRKKAYTAATAMSYEDAAVAMTNEFHIVDGNWVKAISVEYTPAQNGGVNAKAICARYLNKNYLTEWPSMFDQTGNGTTGWNTGAVVATSATSTGGGTNYGFADMMITPNGGQVIVAEDKNWADIELGDAKIVSAVNGATLTFAAADTIPSGVIVGSMKNDSGVCVSGTIPASLPISDGVVSLKNGAVFSSVPVAKINVIGSTTLTADITVTGSELTLANGQINTTNDKAVKFDSDSVIISASGNSSIAKLWGTGHTATINVAEGAELTVGNIVNNYNNTIVKDGEGALNVTRNANVSQIKYQLKAGSIVGKAAETDITPHSSVSGMVIVESEADTDGYTTYTLLRTEPTTITMKDWTGTAFTYVDGEETLNTTLIDGDKIVIPSTIANDDYWQWHFTDGTDAFAGHEVEINKNMNWKWSVGTMTIGSGATVYVFNTYGLNDGASITGEGTLSVNGVDVPVKGAATISCTVAFASGNFKLTTATSTLTCDKLEEGDTITKVTTDVTGKHVEYSDGKYVLVDDKTATDLFLEAVAAASTGDTVTLTGAVELSEQLEIAGKEITIDLNGQTISYAGAALSSGIILVHNGAGLTITGDGTIDSGIAMAAVAVTKKGDDPANPAKLTVNGGTLIGQTYGISGNGTRANTTVTINGGVIKAIKEGDGIGIYQPQLGELTISGGTIEGTTFGVYAKSGSVSISGGTIKSTATEIIDPLVNNNGTTGKGYALVLEKLAAGEGGYANNLTADVTGGTFEGVTAILSWARTGSERLTKFVADGVVLNETTPSAADIKKSYVEPSTDLPGAEELPAGVSTSEYNTWAAANGITSTTSAADATTAATAFVMGVTVDQGQTIAEAAALKADEMLEEIATAEGVDLAALLAQAQAAGAEGLVVTTDNTNLTVKLVPATLGEGVETSAKLFKLSITIKAPSAQN